MFRSHGSSRLWIVSLNLRPRKFWPENKPKNSFRTTSRFWGVPNLCRTRLSGSDFSKIISLIIPITCRRCNLSQMFNENTNERLLYSVLYSWVYTLKCIGRIRKERGALLGISLQIGWDNLRPDLVLIRRQRWCGDSKEAAKRVLSLIWCQ